MKGKIDRKTQEQKEKLRQERLQERFEYESTRTKGYELIYPTKDSNK